MSEGLKKNRPQFRNIHFVVDLPNYRWPMAALVSGAHRFSGLALVLMLPFVLYLLDKSLTSETTFEHFKGITSGWFVKLVLLGLIYGYLQHFCSGIRHLFGDVHIGLSKDGARKSAIAVFAITFTLTALIALKLFGVF
jgi:succinate dehydrogenase / fumarate reductase cytochrome b subunit